MKRCSKCKKRKSLSAFYKHPTGKYGVQGRCKECIKTYQKQYRQTHKLEFSKYIRQYRNTLIGKLHYRFYSITQRCNNPYDKAYKYYGGRGIKCKFKNADDFIKHILNDLEIDRIDNSGHYERGNVRLTTPKENCNNRRKPK